jgi:hypothetical protein
LHDATATPRFFKSASSASVTVVLPLPEEAAAMMRPLALTRLPHQ